MAEPTVVVGPGPGSSPVGAKGIVALGAYFAIVATFLIYSLIALWPTASESATAESTNSAPHGATGAAGDSKPPGSATADSVKTPPKGAALAAGDSKASGSATEDSIKTAPKETGDSVKTPPKGATPAAADSKASVPTCKEDTCSSRYLWTSVGLTSEQRLIVVVLLCGAFGGLLHAIRSLTWYAGNRNLVRSWTLTYLFMPAVGALLAVVFFFVLSAGLFVGPSNLASAKTSGFAAIAVLVGLFNVQAAQKLQEIFETIFTKKPQGADAQKVVTPGDPPQSKQA
jgi:hypothetical protein